MLTTPEWRAAAFGARLQTLRVGRIMSASLCEQLRCKAAACAAGAADGACRTALFLCRFLRQQTRCRRKVWDDKLFDKALLIRQCTIEVSPLLQRDVVMSDVSNVAEQLDTTVEIVTPENISFRYALAGPFSRLRAYGIDLAIRFGAAIALAVGAGTVLGMMGLGGFGFGLTLVGWFVLAFFYGGVFEAYWNGQTPGKRLVGIRVLTIDGRPINGVQAVLRNILRMADMLPFLFAEAGLLGLYQVGLWTMIGNARFQRLGDLVCGTMVVVEESTGIAATAKFHAPQILEITNLIPPQYVPSRSLARALMAYVERRGQFSPQRRNELAQHLAGPLRTVFQMPADVPADALLCAAYQRWFGERTEEETAPRAA